MRLHDVITRVADSCTSYETESCCVISYSRRRDLFGRRRAGNKIARTKVVSRSVKDVEEGQGKLREAHELSTLPDIYYNKSRLRYLCLSWFRLSNVQTREFPVRSKTPI